MRGQLEARDNLRVLLHLAPGCPCCREITAGLWWAGAGRGDDAAVADYGQSMERVFARVRHLQTGLEEERAIARRILARLDGLPVAAWGVRLADAARTWGLCELLLRSAAERAEEPRESEGLARLAAEIPARSPPDPSCRTCRGATRAPGSRSRRPGAPPWISRLRGGPGDREAHLARGSVSGSRRPALDARAALPADQGDSARPTVCSTALSSSIGAPARPTCSAAPSPAGILRACAGDLGGPPPPFARGSRWRAPWAIRRPPSPRCSAWPASSTTAAVTARRGLSSARIDPRQADGAARGRLCQLEGRIAAALGRERRGRGKPSERCTGSSSPGGWATTRPWPRWISRRSSRGRGGPPISPPWAPPCPRLPHPRSAP